MALTSTKEYCTERDLQDVLPNLSGYDLKRRIINFTTTDTTNMYKAYNTGTITVLYFDGIEGTPVTDDPNAIYEFRYSEGNDSVELFVTGSNPNDMIIEAGDDWTSIKQRFIRKASRFVESMIDSRLAREVTKDREGNYPEVIVRLTALKTIIFLLQANDPQNEMIESFKDEFDELMEGIRSGSIVLTNEASGDSAKGFVREVSVSGNLRIVELAGEYTGTKYELYKVKITTAGALGSCKYSVWVKDTDKLKNEKIIDDDVINGDMQKIGRGLFVRFAGGTDASEATLNDEWEIEAKAYDARVSTIGTIGSTRR
tara:strand:- start:1024 stop:1965 length:942 start_codon:yes stop_codon:yes gene_type:complete